MPAVIAGRTNGARTSRLAAHKFDHVQIFCAAGDEAAFRRRKGIAMLRPPPQRLLFLCVVLTLLLAEGAAAQPRPEHALELQLADGMIYTSGGLQLFSVTLARWSPAEVELSCVVGTLRFRRDVALTSAQRTGQYDRSGAFRHSVTVPIYVARGTGLSALPVGRQSVTCTAQVRGTSERAQKARVVALRSAQDLLPDIRPNVPRWFEATDCDSGAAPVSTRPVCVSLTFDGEAGYGAPTAQCTLGGATLGPALRGRGRNELTVRVGALVRGQHALDCTLALLGPGGRESDTTNNHAASSFVVRGTEAEWDYDLEVTAIEPAMHIASVYDQSNAYGSGGPMRIPGVGLNVHVRNRGGDAMTQVSVECRSGATVLLQGEGGPLAAGEARVVEVTAPAVPAGSLALECRATLTHPRGTTDRAPNDNVRRARVSTRQ